jgi:type VI protein secretion system component Hcp
MSDPFKSKHASDSVYDARMSISGEQGSFEVYRYSWNTNGFGAEDSHNSPGFLLQTLCSRIAQMKTMLFTKQSDLVTVGLVEAYSQRKTLDTIDFAARETTNKKRTPVWVASLTLKNVSIVNLKTRQQVGPEVLGLRFLLDWVALEAKEVWHRDYDSEGCILTERSNY